MKSSFSTICCLLVMCGACYAQGIFESYLTGSFGGTASLVAGVGYFRVTGTTVHYQLAMFGEANGSLSAVFATTTFETTFTTGIGEVITTSGCRLYPPNPFLPIPGPSGPYTCPAQVTWADYWGSFELPQGQVAELLAGGGLLRIPSSGWAVQIQGEIAPVPEPSSIALLVLGLLCGLHRKWRTWPNKITGANSRPASPLDSGRQFGCASCAPPSPSAAVAQFCR